MRITYKDASGVIEPLLRSKIISHLFIQTLSEVYEKKQYMVAYLPNMYKQAMLPELKQAILTANSLVALELLRMDFIFKQLHGTRIAGDKDTNQYLNLFTHQEVTEIKKKSYEMDLTILMNLIMIDSIQITSFHLLKKLAPHMHGREVQYNLRLNLNAAISDKKALLQLTETYLH